jgi:Leucine-rich repeat (LRR) protein
MDFSKLSKLQHLREIELVYLDQKKLIPAIDLPNVQSIKIYSTKYEVFRSFLHAQNSLKEIYLEDVIIGDSSLSISRYCKYTLERLSLRNCRLKTIPSEVYFCQSLLYLDLSKNHIDEIKKELVSLYKLRYLSLAENEVRTVPTLLHKLSYLRKLVLANNKISNKNNTEFCFEKLEYLDLSNNNLDTVIVNCPSMKHLFLSNNNLSKLSVETGDLITKLKLSGNKFCSVPNSVYDMTNMEVLYLNDNCIKEIKNSFRLHDNLKIIDFSNNRIKFIQDSAFFQGQITDLKLSKNDIVVMDVFLPHENNLSKVYLSDNKLTKFPLIQFGNKIKVIFLDGNSLTGLDCNTFNEYPSLETLYLRGNPTEDRDALSLCDSLNIVW